MTEQEIMKSLGFGGKAAEEVAKDFLAYSDSDMTASFFAMIALMLHEGTPVPHVWQTIMVNMLIEANTRVDKKNNPVADALRLTHYNKTGRNFAYGRLVGYYFAKTGDVSESCKMAIADISKYQGVSWDTSTIKDIWYEDEIAFKHLGQGLLNDGFTPKKILNILK